MESYEPQGLEGDFDGKTGFARPAHGIKGVPYGINWRGPWETNAVSFAQVTRRTVRAIESAGMPVFLPANWTRQSVFDSDIPDSTFLELGATVTKSTIDGQVVRAVDNSPTQRHLDRILVTVSHISADFKPIHAALFPGNAHILMPGEISAIHPYLIAMTALERDRVDVDTVSMLKRFGQVWVPCERNKAVLQALGVKNAHVVPHPMPEARVRALMMAKGRVPLQGHYVFYTIGKWEPRKNQDNLIRGFLRAFSPIDKAVLLVKTSPFGSYRNYPASPVEALQMMLEEPEVKAKGWTAETVQQKVRINLERLTDREIVDMHAMGNCYVNTSHGEAWELSCYDALSAGNHLIHTGWGGSEDYAVEPMPGLRLWDGKSTEVCHPDYRWGPSRWAKVDIGAIELAYRVAYFDSHRVRSKPPVHHTTDSVGATCRKLILDCCHLTEEQVSAWLRPRRHRRGEAPDGRALVPRRRLRLRLALGPSPPRGAARRRRKADDRRDNRPQHRGPESHRGQAPRGGCARRGLRHRERPGPA